MPVSSYAPEMLLLYRTAVTTEVKVKLDTYNAAVRFRQRMHNLRRDMRKEHHPDTATANRVEISIKPDGTVICRPADNLFVDAIRKAGITPDPAPDPATSVSSSPASEDERADMVKALQDYFTAEG